MSSVISEVLRHPAFHAHPPVLVDVGASEAPPANWRSLAGQSIYLGFDPDSRELRENSGEYFSKALIVDEAVTAAPGANRTKFFLTHSPYCSSTLRPNQEGLQPYLFSDLFAVEREVEVSATTLNSVIERLGLPGIDWLKLDTQGIDLQLYQSVVDERRAHVLAVDVEPGLIDAYHGEDLFVDTHAALVREGFWLSDLRVAGAVRMRRATLAEAIKRQPMLEEARLAATLKSAPGWCEARYLRSLESLARHNAGERDYLLLWVFALIDGHTGFAFELGLDFERRFPHNIHASLLASEAGRLLCVSGIESRLWARLKRSVPGPIKRALKGALNPLFSERTPHAGLGPPAADV